MPTSFSHAEASLRIERTHQAKWLTTPSLEERLQRRLERCLGEIAQIIPEACILVHRTLRISNPPRKFELEAYVLTSASDHVIMKEIEINPGKRKDWESHTSDLVAVATEIAGRWPSSVRPEAIALITDGASLWFNPGRPAGVNREWLKAHLDGESPCAMIAHGKDHYPFDEPRQMNLEQEG